MDSFLSKDEIEKIGFKSVGKNVKISSKASIYSPAEIQIGNNVRIDDFCILSGKILLGSFIHIAAYSALYGSAKGITIDDYVNISSRVCIYAISDDYSGESMTNPMVPDEFKQLISEPVHIKKHVIIGSTSVVMPGVVLEEGGCFGAFSFINKNTQSWGKYVGIPVKRIGERSKKLLEYEKLVEEE